jgi:hypothetical protein
MQQDRFRSSEDETTFRRWRLGVFVLYSAALVVLAGLATATHHQQTFASAAALTNPTIAPVDTRHH